MKILISNLICLLICAHSMYSQAPEGLKTIAQGKAYVRATVNQDGTISEVEFYDRKPYTVDVLNQAFLEQIKQKGIEGLVEFEGTHWKGPLWCDHKLLEDSEGNVFISIEFQGTAKPLKYLKYYQELQNIAPKDNGIIRIEILIEENGKIGDYKIIETDFSEYKSIEVIRAVKRFKFEVPEIDGKKVGLRTILPIKFYRD